MSIKLTAYDYNYCLLCAYDHNAKLSNRVATPRSSGFSYPTNLTYTYNSPTIPWGMAIKI